MLLFFCSSKEEKTECVCAFVVLNKWFYVRKRLCLNVRRRYVRLKQFECMDKCECLWRCVYVKLLKISSNAGALRTQKATKILIDKSAWTYKYVPWKSKIICECQWCKVKFCLWEIKAYLGVSKTIYAKLLWSYT